jgi:hypothetical protein
VIRDLLDKVYGLLIRRRHLYQATFRAPTAEVVLKDLARFCRAHESTAHLDPHVAARLDGRREVWLRIQHHLLLSPDDLWRLYSGRPTPNERLSSDESE